MNQSNLVKAKIHSNVSSINNELNRLKFFNKKIVFTNGCFDLLHRSHIDYLIKAAALGDFLIIGLNTDTSVSRIKGPSRPINDEYSRALILASLRYVDAVILFDDITPYHLIKYILPDVLVKGADYQTEEIVGFDIVSKYGGQVQTIEFLEGYSTTLIEKKIIQSTKNNPG